MATPSLTLDDEATATCFIVIDFEGTTPKGHRPEPIEVACLFLRLTNGSFSEVDRFSALMKPPPHAPLTWFDTQQTGITESMLRDQPPAATVLRDLDRRVTEPSHLLVAHNASVEANMIYDHRDHCPRLASTHTLDTLRLARAVFPELPSHGLDAILRHLEIPSPPNRHRAMPDVEVTAQAFGRIVHHGVRAGHWSTLRQLRQIGGADAKATQPQQDTLF